MKHVATYSVLLLGYIQLHAQYSGEGQAEAFPDTTVPYDPSQYVYNWDSLPHAEYSEDTLQSESDQDTAETWPWTGDTANVAVATYTCYVVEPDPCVESALSIPICGSRPIPVELVDFTHAKTYPWVISGFPWEFDGLSQTTDPYKSWHEINLFDTTRKHFSRIGFAATRAMEISTDPPAETPEPPKPAPLPEQPWYQAVLPTPVRIRKG